MVQSILSENISYKQENAVNAMDLHHETEVFTMYSGRKSIEVAFGKVRNTYAEEGILYMPIYEVVDSSVTRDIGVYEYLAEQEAFLSDGSLSIATMGDPLLFDEKDVFEKKDVPLKLGPEDAAVTQNDYIPNINSSWVARYLKDNEYSLKDNEGGGDCLFAVIRDALEMVGRVVTVSELRDKLVMAVDEETYLNYRSIKTGVAATDAKLSLELKHLSRTHEVLKERSKKDLDLDTKSLVLQEARRTEAAYERALAERNLNKELQEEYEFMSKVNSLEEFKKALKSCDFWADTWAITTLEKALDVKLIILSEDAYNQGDLDNCLLCGQVNDAELQKKGIFQPGIYIITSFGQNHYKLISYRRRGAFTFAEIPEEIKNLIVSKCLERDAGPFALIPEFRTMKNYEPVSDKVEKGEVVFQIYDKSSAMAQPGKGVGEKIPQGLRKDFSLLHKNKNWRRKLDHSWIAPFNLEDASWASVDHYVEAQKFKNSSPDFYKEFMNDSGTKLSQSSAMARAAGKNGKFAGRKVLPKGVVPDPTINSATLQTARLRAAGAKFKQHDDLAALLALTKDAELFHFLKGQPPRRLSELESIRGS